MTRLNVMIVDDEVLAIEHLKALIDWEAEGFCIAGEFFRPLQALPKIVELKPDLIVADIRMPNMDGIELSKRLLSAGFRGRIILLTSYKEFDYVKEALRLGIVSYLVKHELDAKSLRSELSKVKEVIAEEQRRSAMVLRQYLKDLTEGRVPAEELAVEAASSKRVKGKQFVYVVVSVEEPFPVVPFKEVETPPSIWHGELPELPLYEIELAYKKNGKVGFLLMTLPVASRKGAIDMHADAAFRLKAHLEEVCPGVPVCTSYSEPFDRLEALSVIHHNTVAQLTSCLFVRGTKIVGPGHGEDSTQLDTRVVPVMEKVVELFRQGDLASMESLLDNAFEKAAKFRSVPYLREICDRLVTAMDIVRSERGLPALRRLGEEGAIRTQEWRTVEGIKLWLLAKVHETVTGNGKSSPNSRKIREACDYIAVNLAEELSAEMIASRVGISGEHLRHLFKQEMGLTLHDYITACRMEQAKGLLQSGHFKLYEISERVGYKSSYYFSKIFCKTVGMSPLDYAEARGDVR
ncbi:response regulator transcription factor [Paenibacillus ferrarius]|uniref:response regulator transcription factor n=1 Tax=Paenibacillus ferrarius TaxID=1469647 RepID=UPI003D2A07A3